MVLKQIQKTIQIQLQRATNHVLQHLGSIPKQIQNILLIDLDVANDPQEKNDFFILALFDSINDSKSKKGVKIIIL